MDADRYKTAILPPVREESDMAFDETLGSFIRNARVARNLSQQRAADKAGVSRRQWVFLEQGGNVTVEFLARVCAALDLNEVPIAGGAIAAVRTSAVSEAMRIIDVADAIAKQLDALRSVAVTMVMPASERGRGDAAAVGAFFDQHAASDAARIERALRRFAADVKQVPSRAETESRRGRKA